MTNESDIADIVTKNISTADGLAVDWLADNIYWTDTAKNLIEVCRIDGSSRKVVLSKLKEPRSIAVFPRKGYAQLGTCTKKSCSIDRKNKPHADKTFLASFF